MPTEAYDPQGYEEFLGIARGAHLTPEQCYVLMGLTDLGDALSWAPVEEACSSFMIAQDRSATGHLLVGQRWSHNILCFATRLWVSLFSLRPVIVSSSSDGLISLRCGSIDLIWALAS